jgi:hypothetical protein
MTPLAGRFQGKKSLQLKFIRGFVDPCEDFSVTLPGT